MTATRRGRLLVGFAALVMVGAGCGGDVTPSSAEFVDERTIVLWTSCAYDVAAFVTETESEVRIDEVRGDDQSTHAVKAAPRSRSSTRSATEPS